MITNSSASQRKPDLRMLLIPFGLIVLLCLCFFLAPAASGKMLDSIRFFLENTFGTWYLAVGLGFFILSVYLSFSPYGKIRLGLPGEAPRYGTFVWGSMMFTSGLAADILFYSFCEWILYAEDPYIQQLGSINEWAGTYPLFHWGPIPWSFYLVLAVCFGYMLHVRGCGKQKYSEAVRPLLGSATDGIAGHLVDLLAVMALLAGTATTFSLATPLIAQVFSDLFHIRSGSGLTILILCITCLIYTVSVVRGMHAISRLASACVYLFLGLLAYVLLFGGETRFIIETGFSSLGNLAQNFLHMSTWTDPGRETAFPQNWTIFYWAYWMVWCVASPFFIGSISRGRTIRQTIVGGYACALAGTFTSFIILGNYSLGLQSHGRLDVIGLYRQAGDLYATILSILHTLPLAPLVLILLAAAMIAFYATSFDAIALVASAYSYPDLPGDQEPAVWVRVFWSVALILLPIALVFSDSSMRNLQTVSIIAAFPISIVLVLIVAAFFKDVRDREDL